MKHTVGPGPAARAISTLLCIILVLSTLCAIAIGDIRMATTKENTATIIRQTLFHVHTVRPAASVSGQGSYAVVRAPRPSLSRVRLDNESSGVITGILVDWLYDTLSEQYGSELNVTQETLEEFIDQSTLKDDIADLGASLISDFITGENTTTLDEDTITALLTENADLIETYFGIQLDSGVISAMVEKITASGYIAKLQQDGIGGLLLGSTASGTGDGSADADPSADASPDATAPNADTPSDESQPQINVVAELLTSFRKATSVGALIACIAVAGVCIVLLCVLHLKWLWLALRKIGISLSIAALPGMIPTVLALVTAAPFAWMGVVGSVIRMILRITAPVCISVFAAGVVLIIGSVIWKRSTVEKAIMTNTLEGISETLIDEEPEKESTEEPSDPE